MEKTYLEIEALKRTILDQLRESGCRITKQRELLVDIILKENCNNCKEIYYMAAKQDPKIGMATVYRMMNTLEEIGALKWRNEYKICEQEDMNRGCLVEFHDSTSLELKRELFNDILEHGLEARGYLAGRKMFLIKCISKTMKLTAYHFTKENVMVNLRLLCRIITIIGLFSR